MVNRLIVAAIAAFMLTGCGLFKTRVEYVERIVEVRVPVAVMPVPPEQITLPIPPAGPIWIAPADPAATSALDPVGEAALRSWVDALILRIRAWEAWALPVE